MTKRKRPEGKPMPGMPAAPAKPKPKAKPDAGGPQVCVGCGKKWARVGEGGVCETCVADQLPPVPEPPGGWPDDVVPPTPQELKRSRIFEIAQLMASGEWRASMAKTLAGAWSTPSWTMSVKTVQHYSAEASRLLDYTTGQREKLVQIARLRMLQVMQENEGDRVQAARTLLEHLGELRQNVTVKAADPFEGWTEAEIQHYADKGQKPERFGPRKRPAV